MSFETTLFDPDTEWDSLKARAADPHTSHEAALSVDVKGSQVAVLRRLATEGPLADHETEFWLEFHGIAMSPSRVRTARSELVRLGYVHPVEGMFTKTPTGGKTQVWGATPEGHQHIKETGK